MAMWLLWTRWVLSIALPFVGNSMRTGGRSVILLRFSLTRKGLQGKQLKLLWWFQYGQAVQHTSFHLLGASYSLEYFSPRSPRNINGNFLSDTLFDPVCVWGFVSRWTTTNQYHGFERHPSPINTIFWSPGRVCFFVRQPRVLYSSLKGVDWREPSFHRSCTIWNRQIFYCIMPSM